MLDFTPPVTASAFGVIVKAPSRSDPSYSNYTDEFTEDAWIAICLMFSFWWAVMSGLIYWMRRDKSHQSIIGSIKTATNVVLRSIINKVSPKNNNFMNCFTMFIF